MALEFLLIALAVVLFVGMSLGLALAYRDSDTDSRQVPARPQKRVAAPSLYRWSEADAAIAEELMLRQIEHHLRRETMVAEQFIDDPTPRTLRAGNGQPLGTC
jgi:hypothetical protein